MLKYCKKFTAAVLALTLAMGIAACGTEKKQTADNENNTESKVTVVTTLFPYYDFVRAVAGDLVDLELILPPGQESHSFEPTAADLIKIEEADVLIYNGGESEQWVERVLDAGSRNDRVNLSGMDVVSLFEEESSENMQEEEHDHDYEEEHEEEHEHEEAHEQNVQIEYDEHIWTSPVNAIALVEAVRDTLIEVMPQQEAVLTENAKKYTDELLEIDGEIREAVAEGNKDILVFADRFPFLYFVKEYGLRYDAAFAGCSTDTEPSAATIAGLIDLVEEEDIQVVYHVELSSQKTANIIQESTGAEILEMHSCHNLTKEQLDAGVSYVDLMRENIKQLRKGLGC